MPGLGSHDNDWEHITINYIRDKKGQYKQGRKLKTYIRTLESHLFFSYPDDLGPDPNHVGYKSDALLVVTLM
jgi:hypothetical protein